MKYFITTLSLLMLLSIVIVAGARSEDVTASFSWEHPDLSNVSGFKIYSGTEAGVYDSTPVANVTGLTASVIFETGIVYYLVCTAYNEFGESDYSNQVVLRAVVFSPSNFRINHITVVQ